MKLDEEHQAEYSVNTESKKMKFMSVKRNFLKKKGPLAATLNDSRENART